GSLAETPLRSLLESAQGERSTGTLIVRNGNGQSASLYFLFGHLFHAQGGDGKSGDDAVVNALHWTKGDFEFDAKAKLPADETVKPGIPDLVHAAAADPHPAPAREGYTGYVRLLTDDASGLILFREGSALECLYDGAADAGSLVLGKQALQAFNDDVTAGHGVLDVVGLSSELIDGLYELTVSRPMYTELYAAWVDMKALLNFLSERKLSGSVMIRAAAGTGVIILSAGEMAGAYTSESRDIADKPDRALA